MFEAVEIEINSHCNKVCSYCPNSQFQRIEKGFMQPELFSLIVSQLHALNFSGRISFSFYNEPTLNPMLEQFVEEVKKYLPKTFIELYTNAELLDSNRTASLVAKGVDLFTITRHEDVLDDRLEKMIEALPSHVQSHIKFQHFTDIKLTNRGGCLPHLGDHTKTVFLPCFIPNKIVTITLLGHVLPCFEDFFQHNVMGNIKEQSLLEIWESPKYRDFRNHLAKGLRHKYNACKDCSRLEVL